MAVARKRFLTKMNNVTQYQYSSVQISLPTPAADEIFGWGEEQIDDSKIFLDPHDPLYGREDEIHITVLYGLHTEKAELVRELVKYEPTFRVRLGPVSIFTNSNKFDVVKIEVISDNLHLLNEKLSYNLASTILYNKYQPHITVAYVDKGSCSHLNGCLDFNGAVYSVNTLFFCHRDRLRTSIPLAPRTVRLTV